MRLLCCIDNNQQNRGTKLSNVIYNEHFCKPLTKQLVTGDHTATDEAKSEDRQATEKAATSDQADKTQVTFKHALSLHHISII